MLTAIVNRQYEERYVFMPVYFLEMVEGKDWTCRLAAESLVPNDVDLYGPDKPGESHHMYIHVCYA